MKKLIFMVAVLAMAACHKESETKMAGDSLPVEVAMPDVRNVMLTREYPGYLAADATIPVVGRVNGTIVKREFTEGGRVKKGDLLFGKRRAYQRKVAIAPFDGIFSAHGMVLRPKTDVVDERYFPFFIASDQFMDMAVKISVGGLSPTINWKTLKECEFNLPSLARQRELADLLWAANDLKESYKKAISATDEMLKAKFRRFISEGDVVNTPFGELCESLDGRRVPVKSGDRKPGPFPYYGASGIVDYVDSYIFDEDILLVSEDGANLIARVTPIAFSVAGKCWVNNHAHVVRFSNMVTQKFVEYYLEATDISKYITGTAQPKLNKEKLNVIPIPLPPLSLQREFVAIAERADAAKSALKKSIADIDQVMKGLING